MNTVLIITCEHGGNRVPNEYSALFRGKSRMLNSHRGFDRGALELARAMAARTSAALFTSEITRLLVDLNRNRRQTILSFIGRDLSRSQQDVLLRDFYLPYRSEVERGIHSHILAGRHVVHVSVHTFASVLHGVRRRTDIGLLYDPSRSSERQLARAWQRYLAVVTPEYVCRRNYPYRGVCEGFTTYLRRRFPANRYIGLELEVRREVVCGRQGEEVTRVLCESLASVTPVSGRPGHRGPLRRVGPA
ncbi:MAG: N-formylglutamate amidohydrolase [Verrucomicrobia bacterium]|nr:N-formylglutamate amidohydrolase [Verrucomicrobiota bacterium]